MSTVTTLEPAYTSVTEPLWTPTDVPEYGERAEGIWRDEEYCF